MKQRRQNFFLFFFFCFFFLLVEHIPIFHNVRVMCDELNFFVWIAAQEFLVATQTRESNKVHRRNSCTPLSLRTTAVFAAILAVQINDERQLTNTGVRCAPATVRWIRSFVAAVLAGVRARPHTNATALAIP